MKNIHQKINNTDILRVAIVGGSIAGSTAAIELARIGCDVTIYERSKKGLDKRGAGVMLSNLMVENLIKRDLIDKNWAFLSSEEISLILKNKNGESHQTYKYNGINANWGVLHDNLRRRISNKKYIQDRQVASLNELEGGLIKLHFTDRKTEIFDLVVFADGYNSIGRKILFPDLSLKYAGYIAWRGIIEENALSDVTEFENKMINAVTEEGSFISYIIPNRTHETAKGKRLLNWVLYFKIEEKNLYPILTDDSGYSHRSSVPPGSVAIKHISELHRMSSRLFPDFIAEVICKTKEPFIQGIFDIHVPCYHKGQICLIGDAATLARPHTGGGTAKAMTNAINLAHSLFRSDSIEKGLEEWDRKETDTGKMMAELGETLGKEMISEAPIWKTVDELTITKWWNHIVELRNYTSSTTFL